MSGFKVGLAEAMAQMLRSRGLDCHEILDWDDRTVYGGYCETCAYDYVVVDITYRDSQDQRHMYTYDDNFSALIRELAGNE